MRAFVGYALSTLRGVLKWFGVEVSVEKARVQVEMQDLRLAVESFVRDFRQNHPAVAERYEQALRSNEAELIDRMLSALASSPTTRMRVDRVAQALGLPRADVEALIESRARGLVERVDHECRLAVRELRTFIEAARYLATESGDTEILNRVRRAAAASDD